ncbi:hypothetical protein [Rhodococcus daqingensis]|uniref:Uncharacterized protein n=1 Tax=Rhodococcus daqingensis TaxID=2479363 RepID=A0ABW2S331_9NOCA
MIDVNHETRTDLQETQLSTSLPDRDKFTQIFEGTNQIQRLVIARSLAG